MSYEPSFTPSRPTFQHAMRVISGITNSNPVEITTTISHQYIDGLIVRISIPEVFGMQQLDQSFGPVTVIDNISFSLPINSTFFDVFMIPSGNGAFQDPQSIPIGEINSTFQGATQNVLPYSAS